MQKCYGATPCCGRGLVGHWRLSEELGVYLPSMAHTLVACALVGRSASLTTGRARSELANWA